MARQNVQDLSTLPPVVAAAGLSQTIGPDLQWTPDGCPDRWPQGSYLDCCYNSNGSLPVREAVRAGYGILTHNYGLSAPQWCDLFEVSCQPDRSWLPLEDLSGSTARSTASSSASTAEAICNSPHPLVLAAYSARTLQARLDGAKAALRAGGPAAIDARLLITECLPGLATAAKLKALAMTADAAVAAARQDSSTDSKVAQPAVQHGTATTVVAHNANVLYRAAVRAALAFSRYRALQMWDGDLAAATTPDVCDADERSRGWLCCADRMDSALDDVGVTATMLWLRWGAPELPQGANRKRLVNVFKSLCKAPAPNFSPLVMVNHYSLFFAAYAAVSVPGGGPTGQLVKQALASIKQVDPQGWVPRLLAGLEIADATVQPRFMLGSKQEAMACVSLLGQCWTHTTCSSVEVHDEYSSALSLLLKECVDEKWQRKETTFTESALTEMIAQFNTGLLGQHCLRQNARVKLAIRAAQSPSAGVGVRLLGARVLVLVLTAVAQATMNLPPVTTHWQHWQGSVALNQLGATEAVGAAAMLWLYAGDLYMDARNLLCRMKECAEAQRLNEALTCLWTHRLRWAWQSGTWRPERSPDGAPWELPAWEGLLAEWSETLLNDNLPMLLAFVEAEVASVSKQSEVLQHLGHQAACQRPAGNAHTQQQAASTEYQQHDMQQQSQRTSPTFSHGVACAHNVSSGAGNDSAPHGATGDRNGPRLAEVQGVDIRHTGSDCTEALHQGHATARDSGASTSCKQHAASQPGHKQPAASEASTPMTSAASFDVDSSSSGRGGQQTGKPCAQCGLVFAKLKRCAGCGEVRYCSSACQRLHWHAGHQAACSRRLLAIAGAKDQQADVQQQEGQNATG